jgi:hypothetical protein
MARAVHYNRHHTLQNCENCIHRREDICLKGEDIVAPLRRAYGCPGWDKQLSRFDKEKLQHQRRIRELFQ